MRSKNWLTLVVYTTFVFSIQMGNNVPWSTLQFIKKNKKKKKKKKQQDLWFLKGTFFKETLKQDVIDNKFNNVLHNFLNIIYNIYFRNKQTNIIALSTTKIKP